MADITNSIQPASGFHGNSWPDDFALPQSVSTGGWVRDSEGYEQQTFLGASIQKFSMSAGFGDTASTLSLGLVVDEFNTSDGTGHGQGDDVYHNGKRDIFAPPFVGSPVFFKFANRRKPIKDVFEDTIKALVYDDDVICTGIYEPVGSDSEGGEENDTNHGVLGVTSHIKDQYYDLETNEMVQLKSEENIDDKYSPNCALTFGGILQSYTQTRGTDGNPMYNVQVVDPREILGNVKLILNNYAESIYDEDNIMNIYGFLEHNPSVSTRKTLEKQYETKSLLERKVDEETGKVTFEGSDAYTGGNDESIDFCAYPPNFPITGTGFSRRGDQGIPFYRVNQSLATLMQYAGKLPLEYKKASYFTKINFRGFNYVVDLTGLPTLPDFYYLDFDEMSLLELALEICDVSNRDLFVSLLPVLEMDVKTKKEIEGMSKEEQAKEKFLQKAYGETPYGATLYNKNKAIMMGRSENCLSGEDTSDEKSPPLTKDSDFIAGIIRCDAIDRSKQPEIGAVKDYLDELQDKKIYVKNRDVGYEVSNVTTNKIIAGAQETNMYFFSSLEDRRQEEETGLQYDLKEMLGEQVIPYYGMLGDNVVTIPKGHGAYQQILLDTRHLNANGVRSYYVATELEIRAAMISFDKWKEFLVRYNDKYMESVEENDVAEGAALAGGTFSTEEEALNNMPNISENYAVTVPRSVWPCMEFDDNSAGQFNTTHDKDGKEIQGSIPKSACNPPYGFPLYYQRATQIGIPEAGLTQIHTTWQTQIMPAWAEFKNSKNKKAFKIRISEIYSQIKDSFNIGQNDNESDDPSLGNKILDFLEKSMENLYELGVDAAMSFVSDQITAVAREMNTIPRLARRGTENAKRIHSFIKSVGTENLGKKFLVKIPSRVNFNWQQTIEASLPPEEEILCKKGPFGFRALPIDSGNDREFDQGFLDKIESEVNENGMADFLEYGNNGDRFSSYRGALNLHYNPISDLLQANYFIDNQGGFFDFDLYKDLLDEKGIIKALTAGGTDHQGVTQQVIPSQMGHFVNDNGRVSAYARFDNSQFLDFTSIQSRDFTQDVVTASGLIPDVAYNLDNLNEDNDDFTRFYNNDDEDEHQPDDVPQPQTVAFVRCSVDEKIYFSPPIHKSGIKVYGTEVVDKPATHLPKKVIDRDSGDIRYTHGYIVSNFKPTSDEGADTEIWDFQRHDEKTVEFASDEDDAKIIFRGIVDDKINDFTVTDTTENVKTGVDELKKLVNAYALITLPGRIAPTKDARFRDGPYQLIAPETIKHYLTMDVVKGVEGFDKPGFVGQVTTILEDLTKGKGEDGRYCSSTKFQQAKEAYRKALEGLQFCFPQILSKAMPSPVYPDLVVLPLRSKDRFYGPWRSSVVDPRMEDEQKEDKEIEVKRYRNLGGAVEFVKDENLAPWNYFGYSKMNEAGKIKASFANSLLLLSERGGFVTAGAPTGVSLAKELMKRGPLVTNVSVDVAVGGITTTTQLDLYTSSFGKLKKQKELEISRSSRERKKLSDEKNALIRRGIGKSQTDQNYKNIYRELEDKMKVFEDTLIRGQDAGQPAATELVATVRSEQVDRFVPSSDGSNAKDIKAIRQGFDVAVQSSKAIKEAGENFPSPASASKSYYNSAGGSFGQVYTPASMEPFHPNMPSNYDGFIKARDELHTLEDTFNITLYED